MICKDNHYFWNTTYVNQEFDLLLSFFCKYQHICSSIYKVFYNFASPIAFQEHIMDFKKEHYRLTLPIFIDIALVMLLGAVDTIMLSRYSDNAVASVGLDNQIINFVFLVYQFVSMGAAILCAQYFGAGLRKRFIQILGIALTFNLLLALAISGTLYFFAEEILTAYGVRPYLMKDGVAYLQITGVLSFFQAVSLTITAALRSVGKTTKPMLATVAVNIVNILGDYALIFGHFGCPAMGVEGAAWATACSRGVATLILICFLPNLWRGPRSSLTTSLRKSFVRNFTPFPWQEFRNLIKVGIPAMSEEMSYCMSQMVIMYFINQISTESLTTKVYCTTCILFVILMSSSFVQGGAIMVGHFVGQLRYRAAYILGNYVYHSAMRATLIVAAPLAIFGHYVISMLTDNSEIITMATWIFVIDWVLNIGRVRNIFACGMLRSAGDVVYPVVVGVIVQWSVAVGVAWFLGIPLGFGLIGIWVGFCLDENIRGIILMRRWHSQRWQGKSFTVKH